MRCTSLWLVPLAAIGLAHAAEPTAVAVEFYNTTLGHYFVTAGPDEAVAIDAGRAGPGWLRTGGQFGVFSSAADAADLNPVCRFYDDTAHAHYFTIDAAECASLRQARGWTYEGIAFYVPAPQGGDCAAGTTPIYRSVANAGTGAASHRYTVDYTAWVATSGFTPEAVVMCAPLSANDVLADARRLMRQATFGPSETEAQRIASMGPAAWVQEQLGLPVTAYPAYPWVPANRATTCVDDRTPPIGPDSFCARDNYSLFPLQNQFFKDALTQRDQLRGRVAFALSQVMVTSGIANPRNYAMRGYQQLLRDHAFGNFYDLLLAVTLSPQMGDYLNMANNNKANTATGTQPNENYAREIMQLFSIGLYLLNPDGTPKLDAQGNRIPTYDQDVIEGFAHVFTGWTFAPVDGVASRNNNPRNFLGTLIPVSVNHDFGSKELLGGTVAPAALRMNDDLAFAHGNIFMHPNAGPFIGKQLIQKLVTSDPSPGYVARVSAVFADDGFGRRGDLASVIRAILLDPEARGARKIDPGYGKLVEPVLFMTNVARAFGAQTDGVFFRAQSSALGEFVFYAPSVFNFYPFDYVVPGTQLAGPEFGVQTSTTAISRANFANQALFGNGIAPDPLVYGATGTQFDLSRYQAVAGDANALVERVNADLMAGSMSAAMRAAVVGAVNAVAAADTLARARTALYLVLTSPQYQVQR